MKDKTLKSQALVIFIVLLVIIFILLAIIAYLVFQLNSLRDSNKDNTKNINSYKECVDAGYAILETYPTKCVTSDGKSFTNPDQTINPNMNEVDNRTETFSVYFPKKTESDPTKVYEAQRSIVGRDWGTIEQVSLEYLISGPIGGEKALYYSAITLTGSSNCSNKDFTLVISDKVATVKFCKDLKLDGDLSGGRVATSIEKTLKQFNTTITDVRVLDKNGNCVNDLSGLNHC